MDRTCRCRPVRVKGGATSTYARTYAAWRWLSGACRDTTFGTSILSVWVGSDSFSFEEERVRQVRSIPTMVTRAPTIPQSPHDISHLFVRLPISVLFLWWPWRSLDISSRVALSSPPEPPCGGSGGLGLIDRTTRLSRGDEDKPLNVRLLSLEASHH